MGSWLTSDVLTVATGEFEWVSATNYIGLLKYHNTYHDVATINVFT